MAIFDYNPSAITPFPYWRWNKVLPAVYDDSVSQYEMLCRLLSVVNNIIESTNSTGEQVEALTQLVQQLIDGGFPSGLVEYVNDMVEAAMADDVAAINATIAALQAQVDSESSSVASQISAINNTITNLATRNDGIILLGDSYAQGVHSYSESSNGINWMDVLVDILNLTNVYKYKGGSAGFVAVSTSTSGSSSPVPTGTNYQQILQNAYNYINGLGKANEIKHIVIQAGVNDASYLGNSQTTETDISLAIANFLNNVKTWFPNAKVYINYISCGSTYWSSATVRRLTCPRVYRNASLRYGASYGQCTNLPWTMLNAASHDGSHPNEEAQKFIAGYLSNVLQFGSCEDYVTRQSANGFIYHVTADHFIEYESNVYTAIEKTWSDIHTEIIPANEARRFGGGNFVAPFIYRVGGIDYIGVAQFNIDGSVEWKKKGEYTGSAATSMMQLPAARVMIG